MSKVKEFASRLETEEALDTQINTFFEENKHYKQKTIHYQVSNGYRYALVEYEEVNGGKHIGFGSN